MLFKITKKIAIILIILLLTGCSEVTEKSTNEKIEITGDNLNADYTAYNLKSIWKQEM